MSVYKFTDIVKKAKECQSNVKKKYSTGISDDWTYYFAKAVISPKKDITKFSFKSAKKPTGTDISRQIKQSDYLNICKKLVKETESHKQLPNNVEWGKYKLKPLLLKEIFSRILVLVQLGYCHRMLSLYSMFLSFAGFLGSFSQKI